MLRDFTEERPVAVHLSPLNNMVTNFAWFSMPDTLKSWTPEEEQAAWKIWFAMADQIGNDTGACHEWCFWTMKHFESWSESPKRLAADFRAQLRAKMYEVTARLPADHEHSSAILERFEKAFQGEK